MKQSPTPYLDVNETLALLNEQVVEVLGSQFVGMYLYGSLASGDFNPRSSDIDFLVVTAEILDENKIVDLDTMHQRIWNSGLKWAAKLEGSYLPQEHMPRYEKSSRAYPTINEQKFFMAPHGSDWIIQRRIIREQGIVLSGPDPKPMIDEVSPDDIRHAVTDILEDWWFPMLDNPSWLRDRGTEYHAYAILTMCRSLYALEHGEVVSKPIAAGWAQKELGGKWVEVIEQSLTGWDSKRKIALYNDALALIWFTMEKLK